MTNIDRLLTHNSLKELAHLSHSKGELGDVSNVIVKLYAQNDDEALDLVLDLAMSQFGGVTHKAEFQIMSALGALHWEAKGIKKLGVRTIETNSFRAINNVTHLLSHISSKTLADFPYTNSTLPSISCLDLGNDRYKSQDIITAAKETLIDVVKSVEKEEVFPLGIIHNLGFRHESEKAQEHTFAALIARWFNFSSHGLSDYIALVNEHEKQEIDYQNFLKTNPYILEPFHAQIWSKPKFGEELIPDFLIRSMDNNYTVVEIEQPDFPIMTKAGELSAKTTHAKRQALDFRDWAINNRLYATQRFNHIYRPFCLVVIGRESELDTVQIQRLRQENEATQGILKIVGFDWLYDRAKATFDNLIKFGFERETFKETING